MRSFESDETVSLPLSKGGLGLRSAVRSRVAAHWASWADCLPMVQKRHPQVAGIMLQGLNGGRQTISLNVARECATSLAEAGCELPTWLDLVDGVRPPIPMDMGIHFSQGKGGSISCRTRWKNATCTRHFPCCLPHSALSFGLRVDPSLRDHSCVARPRDSRSSSLSHSASCSFVACTWPSPCLPAVAGVAVHSTALATTGQLVRLQGCWGGVGLPLRAPSPGYAVREEHACQRTCSCEIWISER